MEGSLQKFPKSANKETSLIVVSELSKAYGNRQVLSGLSFRVEANSVTAFLGANGAGKTTTLDILSACLGKDSGSVMIGGIDLDDDPYSLTRKIGYLPEHPLLYGELNVEEALTFIGGIRKLPSKQLKNRISYVLSLVSLETEKRRLIKTLSKGMKQRLGFAQALLHEPPVLILDEPMDGLDPAQIVEFKQIIGQLAHDRTILVSSHNLALVEGFCNHVIILKEGRVSADGKLHDLLAEVSSSRTYQLKFERNLDLLLKEINSKKFLESRPGIFRVQSSQVSSGSLEVELPANGFELSLDRLIETAVKLDCGLRQLKWEQSTLEDVYFDVTKG